MSHLNRIVFALLLVAAAASHAQDPEIATAAPPSDKTNYLSDRIKFQTRINAFRIDMAADKQVLEPICAPAFTTFRGIGKMRVEPDVHSVFVVSGLPGKSEAEAENCPESPKPLKKRDVVIIKQPTIDATPPDRYGLTYGTLMVPFKYHFHGDKDFTGSTSLGGYMGFRQDKSGPLGLALQYVGFLGAASVSVPQTVNGNTTSQNMMGVSYGVGLLGTLKNDFHLGVVLGADRVNASAGYKDNGKAWLAVSLGFEFSN